APCSTTSVTRRSSGRSLSRNMRKPLAGPSALHPERLPSSPALARVALPNRPTLSSSRREKAFISAHEQLVDQLLQRVAVVRVDHACGVEVLLDEKALGLAEGQESFVDVVVAHA